MDVLSKNGFLCQVEDVLLKGDAMDIKADPDYLRSRVSQISSDDCFLFQLEYYMTCAQHRSSTVKHFYFTAFFCCFKLKKIQCN